MVHTTKERKQPPVDALYAKSAFYLSLGFWFPLFNIALCLVALWLGFHALKKIRTDPKTYGGFGYAVAGVVIGLTGLILTASGFLLYLFSGQICTSAICVSP